MHRKPNQWLTVFFTTILYLNMKKNSLKLVVIAGISMATVTSCTTYTKTMREPNSRVEFKKDDFTLSGQVSGTAKTTTVLSIDWARFFTKREGQVKGNFASISFASIPVIGSVLSDRTANYALYEMMQHNPRYDVVFYPQYETKVLRPILGLGFLSKITTVKATARLGRLNGNGENENDSEQ